mmetsp:Transcript_92238/g.183160  ORF Transcript_92238/g.183160 Transcript_92238/m.183160 type:complete len:207 (+) Transcript_92238:69-689(+)
MVSPPLCSLSDSSSESSSSSSSESSSDSSPLSVGVNDLGPIQSLLLLRRLLIKLLHDNLSSSCAASATAPSSSFIILNASWYSIPLSVASNTFIFASEASIAFIFLNVCRSFGVMLSIAATSMSLVSSTASGSFDPSSISTFSSGSVCFLAVFLFFVLFCLFDPPVFSCSLLWRHWIASLSSVISFRSCRTSSRRLLQVLHRPARS